MPFDDTMRQYRKPNAPVLNDEGPYWFLAVCTIMLIAGFGPLVIMLFFLLVAVWRPIEEGIDLMFSPSFSEAGEQLTLGGRLTHGWLWSDNPALGAIDRELDQFDELKRFQKATEKAGGR
jgi:hypothetical protein